MQDYQLQHLDDSIDETGSWLSIGDLMSGLLMIFALMLILALLQLTEAAEKAKSSRVVIIQSLQESLKAQGITAEVDPHTGDISIMDSVLFDLNQSALKAEGQSFLDAFVPVYSKAIFSDPAIADQVQHVIVEGHTSSGGSWDHNMSLSLNRANSVSKAISDLDFSSKSAFQSRLLVSGRGETEATQWTDSPADRKVLFRFQFKNDRFLHWFLHERGL